VALVEVRRFADLQQALVARSALEARGLHPFVFDSTTGSVLWIDQFALGGIRLMAPEDEVAVARELLADPAAGPQPWGPPTLEGGTPAGIIAAFGAATFVGWPLAGFKRPGRFHRAAALLLTLGAVALLAAPLLARLLQRG
jgi:hypothetical protein